MLFPLSFSAIVMLLIFVVLLVGTGVAFWKLFTDPTAIPRRAFAPAIIAQGNGTPRSDSLFQTQVRETEAEFQEAKHVLASCQSPATPGLDAALTNALQRWGNAAANYSDALARYGNFLIDSR